MHAARSVKATNGSKAKAASFKRKETATGKARSAKTLEMRGQVGVQPTNGGELKFHDVDLDDAVVASTGTITATINIIPTGTTESTRIGRKCTIRNIGWRYSWQMPEQDAQATPASADILRIILYVDKQANAATATVSNFLSTADFQSFNQLQNKDRFITLMDRTVETNYNALASDGAGVVSQGSVFGEGSFFKRVNIPIEYSGATGAITEIRSNNIGVLLISAVGIVGFFSKFRLRFTDN